MSDLVVSVQLLQILGRSPPSGMGSQVGRYQIIDNVVLADTLHLGTTLQQDNLITGHWN